jgi:hypothetical protein
MRAIEETYVTRGDVRVTIRNEEYSPRGPAMSGMTWVVMIGGDYIGYGPTRDKAMERASKNLKEAMEWMNS